MERLIYNQFIEYIEKNKILSNLQFGFQKNKSTEHAISSIFTDITNALTRKHSSYCIFLDFAKAFDTVNHKILVQKLDYYGVKGSTLALFENYLSNRVQVVEVNGKISSLSSFKLYFKNHLLGKKIQNKGQTSTTTITGTEIR